MPEEFDRTLACFVQGWKANTQLRATRVQVGFLRATDLGRQGEVDRATARASFRVLVDNVVSNKCVSVDESTGERLKRDFEAAINENTAEGLLIAEQLVKRVDDIVFEKGGRYW